MFTSEDNIIEELHELLAKNLKETTGSPLHKRNKETRYLCPSPECPSNDSSSKTYGKIKLSVSWEKNYFNCWLCGFKGHSISKLKEFFLTEQDRNRFTHLLKELYKTVDTNRREYNVIQNNIQDTQDNNFFSLLHTTNKKEKSVLDYTLNRGLEKKHILFYDLKGCIKGKYKNRVIVPSYNNQKKLNYFLARDITGLASIPYKNPENILASTIIFNEYLIEWQKPLIIVEGVFDYLKLHSSNRTAILGSKLGTNDALFKKILLYKTPVVLFLDPDAHSKTKEIKENLEKWVTVTDKSSILINLGIKDPGEIDLKNIEHVEALKALTQ